MKKLRLFFKVPICWMAQQFTQCICMGMAFYVVGKGFGNYDNETDPKNFNLVDPVEVNTFSVPKNGWLAIRFVANNPS